MFDSIGWIEILVLGLAGLFILGPERLPAAAAWVGRNLRKAREFASGARDQLRSEMGSEFDELRKPLQDLQQLRNFDPKRAVARHLFDDGDAGNGNGSSYPTTGATGEQSPIKPSGHRTPAQPQQPRSSDPGQPDPGQPGGKPPFDPDAT